MCKGTIWILILLLAWMGWINTHSIEWNRLHVEGDLPPPRSQHSAVLRKSHHEMIIFAGLHLYNSLSDCFAFDMVKNHWREIKAEGSVPPPIRKHTAVLSEDENTMVVFGGVGDDGKLYSDVYLLDLISNKWTIAVTTGDKPVARIGHTAALISGNRMIIFGGNSDRSMLNELHIYDISKKIWKKQTPSGDIPVARTSTIASMTGNYFSIFGGIKYYGDIYGYLNDFYRYDVVNNKWTKVQAGGEKVDPRANYCAVTTSKGNYLVLHGYWTLYQDDALYLDSSTDKWVYLDDSVSQSIPLGRSHASSVSVINGDNTKVYLFGGNDGDYGQDLGYKNDIWIAQGSGF